MESMDPNLNGPVIFYHWVEMRMAWLAKHDQKYVLM